MKYIYIYIYKEPIIEWVELKGCNGIWKSVGTAIAVDRGDEKAKLKERERGDNTHWTFMLSFSFIWTLKGTEISKYLNNNPEHMSRSLYVKRQI